MLDWGASKQLHSTFMKTGSCLVSALMQCSCLYVICDITVEQCVCLRGNKFQNKLCTCHLWLEVCRHVIKQWKVIILFTTPSQDCVKALWMCYKLYLKQSRRTRTQLVTLTKPSGTFLFWLYIQHDTKKRKKKKKNINIFRIPQISDWCKYRAPCNNVMKLMSWLFIISFFLSCVWLHKGQKA